MWKYVWPSNSNTTTGRFVPNSSSCADTLNFMASLAQMVGKDSPPGENPSISMTYNMRWRVHI
jgi:hypothetical protein